MFVWTSCMQARKCCGSCDHNPASRLCDASLYICLSVALVRSLPYIDFYADFDAIAICSCMRIEMSWRAGKTVQVMDIDRSWRDVHIESNVGCRC